MGGFLTGKEWMDLGSKLKSNCSDLPQRVRTLPPMSSRGRVFEIPDSDSSSDNGEDEDDRFEGVDAKHEQKASTTWGSQFADSLNARTPLPPVNFHITFAHLVVVGCHCPLCRNLAILLQEGG